MELASTPKEADELVARLDRAVNTDCMNACCGTVKDVLEEAFEHGASWLPERFRTPAADKYARRLLHRDPEGRYSVVVMVWSPGQGTPLHDHAGEWCVECVVAGTITVTSYDKVADGPDYKFSPETEVCAGCGQAGALIPPFEYHTIENRTDEPAVTVHVYGHELQWCHIFLPKDGAYERVKRELCYTD